MARQEADIINIFGMLLDVKIMNTGCRPINPTLKIQSVENKSSLIHDAMCLCYNVFCKNDRAINIASVLFESLFKISA
jgi:hypothetical protein